MSQSGWLSPESRYLWVTRNTSPDGTVSGGCQWTISCTWSEWMHISTIRLYRAIQVGCCEKDIIVRLYAIAREVNEQVVQLPYTLSMTSSRLLVTSSLPSLHVLVYVNTEQLTDNRHSMRASYHHQQDQSDHQVAVTATHCQWCHHDYWWRHRYLCSPGLRQYSIEQLIDNCHSMRPSYHPQQDQRNRQGIALRIKQWNSISEIAITTNDTLPIFGTAVPCIWAMSSDIMTATRQLGADANIIVDRLLQTVVPSPSAARCRLSRPTRPRFQTGRCRLKLLCYFIYRFLIGANPHRRSPLHI